MRVAIAGAGGHGKVVADALLAQGGHELAGFLDDNPAYQRGSVLRYPVLGDIASWTNYGLDALIVAIGDNTRRKRVFQQLAAEGARFVTVRHPSAVLAQDVSIGSGTVMLARSVVNTSATLAENIILNTASTVDHDCQIGPHAHLAPGVHLAGDVQVAEGAFLGIGAVVLPGLTIGAWSTVGAGAVVIRDVPDGAKVLGVPAREQRARG